jgi:hypothetical protein
MENWRDEYISLCGVAKKRDAEVRSPSHYRSSSWSRSEAVCSCRYPVNPVHPVNIAFLNLDLD